MKIHHDVLLGVLTGVAIFLIALAAWGTLDGRAAWLLSRGAGIVGYLLLWASVVSGLLLSTRLARGVLKPAQVNDIHRYLSQAALAYCGLHALLLLGSTTHAFSLIGILVPFASDVAPLTVAAGQIAFLLVGALVVSFYMRRRLGPRGWRLVHFGSFAAYGLALVHGLAATGSLLPLYFLTASTVVFLTTMRVAADRPSGARPIAAGRSAGA